MFPGICFERSGIIIDIKAFKGLIFDLDGTLIDSASVWHDIDVKILEKRGILIPDDYAKMVSVMNFQDAAEYTKKRFDLRESPDEMISEWFDMALFEYSHNIRTKPHAVEFLRESRNRGARIALATASHKELYTAVLKNNGILDCFDQFSSTDEVLRGKGYPDVYEHAAAGIGLSPNECVVFEDIIEGIRGAKAGGFSTVAFLNGAFPGDDELMRNEADLCITDYIELMTDRCCY